MFEMESKMIPFFITTWLMCVIFIFFLVAFAISIKSKRVKKEHDLLKALIDEKERTMYSISSEIHDNINQVLHHTKMTLKMANRHAVPEQVPYLDQASKFLTQAVADLRNISHSLNSAYLKNKGMVAALQEEAARIDAGGEVQCLFDVSDEIESFEPDVELMVIRIVQEAINNALKHAVATKVVLAVHFSKDLFRLEVRDDGKGFVIDPHAPWNGLGLHSMQERSRVVGMHLVIRSKVGEGTCVELTMPEPVYLVYG